MSMSGIAALCARKEKRLASDAREPFELGEARMKPSHDRWSAEGRQPIAACKSLNPGERCPKATNSKAASHARNWRLLPSPIRCFGAAMSGVVEFGVQAKRPDPTETAYALPGRPQAAFSWRWNFGPRLFVVCVFSTMIIDRRVSLARCAAKAGRSSARVGHQRGADIGTARTGTREGPKGSVRTASSD
jgi:hypothetical protein